MITTESAEYDICGDGTALLRIITGKCGIFIIPSEISTENGQKYKIIGISKKFPSGDRKYIITFDNSSYISDISLSFIYSNCISIILPPSLKCAKKEEILNSNKPIVVVNAGNKFISVLRFRYFLNHHPLELVSEEFHRNRLYIRETTRIIGSYAFSLNKIITTVVVPQSVELINDSAFLSCKNLVRVLFKGKCGLKRIGNDAFACSSIIYIDIPSSVEEIGSSAFSDCQNLSSITIPPAVKEIHSYTFNRCYNLESVTFPKDSRLKTIGTHNFSNTNVKSFEFPASLNMIEKYSFCNNKNLESVSFADGTRLYRIGIKSFCHNKNLVSLSFGHGSSIDIVDSESFSFNNLKSIELPGSIRSVSSFAFNGNFNLTSVSFENGSKPKYMSPGSFTGTFLPEGSFN